MCIEKSRRTLLRTAECVDKLLNDIPDGRNKLWKGKKKRGDCRNESMRNQNGSFGSRLLVLMAKLVKQTIHACGLSSRTRHSGSADDLTTLSGRPKTITKIERLFLLFRVMVLV